MTDNLVLALDGAWKVLLVGLTLGAGLPVLFALGVRALAAGQGADEPARRPAWASGLAILCFGLVVLGVVLGVGAIVASGFDVELTQIFG